MCLWGPRRNDLVAYLQRRIEATRDEGRDWMLDVEVAVGRDEMERALQSAGLANGVEPERRR